MDIATHAMLGATAGYAFGGNRFGRSAPVIGALSASLPDLDVLLRNASDPLFTLELHRHFSHSLIFAIGVSIVLGVFLHRAFDKSTALHNVVIVLAGYLSAILLDACTSYGTHLFWPFNNERVALSIVSIVDPVIMVVLITGLWAALRRKTPGVSAVALGMFFGYLCLGALQQHRAQSVLDQTMDRLHPELTERLVKPSFGNVLLWRGLAWNDTSILATAVRPGLLGETRVYPGERATRPDFRALAAWSAGSFVRANDVKRFAALSEQLLIAHPSRPAMLGDARYALLPNSLEPLWGIETGNATADEHVLYVTNRNMTTNRRSRFITMLLGRDE